MNFYLSTFVIVLAIATQSKGEETKSDVLVKNKKDLPHNGEGERDGKVIKVVGFYSQTTLLSLLTRTTSAIFTCLSITGGPSAIACNGRRRRRSLINEFNGEISEQKAGDLDGSHNTDGGSESFVMPIVQQDERTGRRVTVWSTTYSTLEVFITNGIIGSTVTVSALCNAIGNSFIGPSCFVG